MARASGVKPTTSSSRPATRPADGVYRDFWENHLQMCLDPWLQNTADPVYMKNWVGELNKRQLRMLCDFLGCDGEAGLEQQRESVLSCNGRLTPYYLVERFAYRRSRFAVSDYAATILAKEVVDSCRVGDVFDTLALLFALYHENADHLRTVYHLEKVHSTGFARMKLKGRARKPDNKEFKDFLTTKLLTPMLANFDAHRDDGRTSELMNIVPDTDHPVVFIRREEQRSMLLKASRAVHGFRPEWIILDFRDNGRRVDISSHSMSVPLEIANRVASAYFGTDCEYENEVEVTPKALIDKFLDHLKRDGIDFLKLVEVHVRNSPLDGSPVIKLNAEGDDSVGEGVRHFEKTIGAILNDIELIKAIKVLYCGKRVKLTFEPVADVSDGYCVRYADKTLNKRERTAFEKKVRAEPHGIRVISTEKRHKQARGGPSVAAVAD